MSAQFTIGIEEEYQLVDQHTGQLGSHIHKVLEKGAALFGDHLKPEMLQGAAEIISTICPDVATARLQMLSLRTRLSQFLHQQGLALISAGTHPTAYWQDQLSTQHPRYAELEEEFQDIARSILIFALHVHIGVENKEETIVLLNQLRSWLPQLLALSSNSPFWAGRFTGLKSHRAIVWRRFPRSGVPEPLASWHEFDHYVQSLVQAGCIDNGKKIWWDIRPHAFYNTIEFRICDMPATFDETMAIVALCQALVAKLSWLHKRGMMTPVLPRAYIEENKWRAARYGLDAEVVDFLLKRRFSMREAISETLDFVEDVASDLGTRREMDFIRMLLEDPRGTGADRQIDVYRQTGSIDAVVRLLMEQTMQGITLDHAEQTLAS